jgi:enoyl-CoA hydratase/carnithine racemase
MLVVLCLTQGAGRAFSAGGDLKMFYDGRNTSKCATPKIVLLLLCFLYVSLCHNMQTQVNLDL